MTIEEAGQRVLEGKPWLQCGVCTGNGLVHTIDPEDDNGENCAGCRGEDCSACHGSGSVLDPSFAEACELLKMPTPVSLNVVVFEIENNARFLIKEYG